VLGVQGSVQLALVQARTYLWLGFEAEPGGGEELAVVVGQVGGGHLGVVSGLGFFLDGMVLCWVLVWGLVVERKWRDVCCCGCFGWSGRE
jgi:hypothetical protein